MRKRLSRVQPYPTDFRTVVLKASGHRLAQLMNALSAELLTAPNTPLAGPHPVAGRGSDHPPTPDPQRMSKAADRSAGFPHAAGPNTGQPARHPPHCPAYLGDHP